SGKCGGRAIDLCFIHGSELLFVRIHKNVGERVGISNKVVQAAAIIGQRVELLHGNAALVFDDSFQAPVNITSANDDAIPELVLESGDIFVGVLHTNPGLEGFATAEADRNGIADPACSLIEQVSRIG